MRTGILENATSVTVSLTGLAELFADMGLEMAQMCGMVSSAVGGQLLDEDEGERVGYRSHCQHWADSWVPKDLRLGNVTSWILCSSV